MAKELGNGVLEIVKKDTLWAISGAYLSTYGKECNCTTRNEYINYLATLNELDKNKTIVVGQKLYLSDSAKNGGGPSSPTGKPTSSNQVKIKRVGLVSDSSSGRELLVTRE